MINVADGTAKDYEDLIQSVIEKVKEHSGITLEREVRILGESLSVAKMYAGGFTPCKR
ncbi:UDP-N-acetylmuramate dehydrogenase [Streptococcus pneumoniae]|nr:UDP-N-acetylmuramate dehydrogenase [Streptococcus pneumoniae]